MSKWIRIFLMITVLTLAACGGNNVETTMSEPVDDFEFTTQDGNTLSRDDLKGQWWVADFVFTNCTSTCPPMTRNMKILQERLQEADVENVHLVSFSVDPDQDTPEVLKEYANEHGADLNNWSFLTGYEFETIKEFSIKSFKNLVQEPPEGDDQVTHGTAFFLVNPDGEVIKNYTGTEVDQMDQIVDDLKNLQ